MTTPKISKWTSLFKKLTDKDFKQKNSNQIRLISAIQKEDIKEIDGLLDNKIASPNDPVWFTKKTFVSDGVYFARTQKNKLFVSPIQFVLNNIEGNYIYRQTILEKLVKAGGVIKETDVDPEDFLKVGSSCYELGELFRDKTTESIKMVSQQGIDWENIYTQKSEFNKEYTAERLIAYIGEKRALEAGIGWDKETNIPFNAFTNPQKLKKDNSVTCLSVNSHFAPITFAHIIQQVLGLSRTQAKETTDNLISGKEIVVPFTKHEQALHFSRMMEELGVFTSSPAINPEKMVNVADVLVLNREKKEKQEKPSPMFFEPKNNLS